MVPLPTPFIGREQNFSANTIARSLQTSTSYMSPREIAIADTEECAAQTVFQARTPRTRPDVAEHVDKT
jgi:hypothetical protein